MNANLNQYSAVSANAEDVLSRGGSLADAFRFVVSLETLINACEERDSSVSETIAPVSGATIPA